jgi:hypothetical protein
MTERKLGNMERTAHRKYPRYAAGYGPHAIRPLGKAERATTAGVLRVTYGGDLRWHYELDGKAVKRDVAVAALTKRCPCTCCDH